MKREIVTVNIKNAFGWRFKDSQNKNQSDKVKETQSDLDLHIGFEKDQREIILKHLETLLRQNTSFDIRIPLNKTPHDSPHHLDNKNEILESEKISFKELIISRIKTGRKVEINDSTIKLLLDYNALTNLFTRLYICMEIYATIEDNIILLKGKENSEIRLVIWGVVNGKPIYY
jgi:hypothetical protein